MKKSGAFFRAIAVFVLILALNSCDTPQGQELFGNALQVGGGLAAAFGNNQTVKRLGFVAVGVGTAIVIKARHAQAAQLAEAQRRANRYHGKSRYVAQRVTKDSKATGAASVVLYDTKTQEVVGDSVYDLNNLPKKGSTLAVAGKTAEFSP